MMRQILAKEFGFEDLPVLLRQIADWLEQERPKVWSLDFETNEDYGGEQWAGYVFCFPDPPEVNEES